MKSLTLEQIAELTSSRLIGDSSVEITGVADLSSAGPMDISFLAKPQYGSSRYEKAMQQSQAAAIFLTKDFARQDGLPYLITDHPSKAFQQVLEYFSSDFEDSSAFKSIHETAIIHESVTIGEGVTIHPYAVIDQGVTIGDRCLIGSGVYIGPHSSLGTDCLIHSNVVLREYSQLGNRVILQPGAVIGSCGFGYDTNARGIHSKLRQVGHVLIEDDVEIGANTSIDRARFKVTKIKKGTKVDNLVQIAHGVEIGEHSFIVSQTGIAGSSKIGKHCVLAGQSAVVGHVELGDGVILAGKTAASKSLLNPGKYGGTPAVPIKDYHRQEIHLRNLDKTLKRLKECEKRLEQLEQEGKA